MVIWTWSRMLGQDFDISRAGEWGREMFEGYAALQIGLAIVLAPILVALGVVEEKQDGTLELLALTRLSTPQILYGKVLSRLIVMLTIVLAGLPVLAAVMSLGGVSTVEIVSTTVNTGVIVLVLGVIGGHTALYAKNALTAAIVAWIYAGLAFIGPLIPYALLTDDLPIVTRPWDLSPAFGPMAESWFGLMPAVAFVPIVVMVAWLSVPVFRIRTTTSEHYGEELLSRDVWAIERFKTHVSVTIFGLVVAFPFVWACVNGGWPSVEGSVAMAWLWSAGFLYAGTGLYLNAVRSVHRAISAREESARMVDEAMAERTWRGPVERLRASLQSRDGTVWGNPVAWRELFTRAHGAARLWSRAGLVMFTLFLSVAWSCEGAGDEEINMVLGAMGVIASGIVTVLAATATMVEERRSGALPVLLTTTMQPWRIIWGKLVAVLGQGLPLLVPAAALLLVGIGQYWDEAYRWTTLTWDPYAYCGDHFVTRGMPAAKVAWMVAWTATAWVMLVLASMVVALRVRPMRMAWVVNIGLGVAFLALPIFLERAFFGIEIWVQLREFWHPWSRQGFGNPMCGVSPTFVASTATQATLALALFALLTARLRRWGTME